MKEVTLARHNQPEGNKAGGAVPTCCAACCCAACAAYSCCSCCCWASMLGRAGARWGRRRHEALLRGRGRGQLLLVRQGEAAEGPPAAGNAPEPGAHARAGARVEQAHLRGQLVDLVRRRVHQHRQLRPESGLQRTHISEISGSKGSSALPAAPG